MRLYENWQKDLNLWKEKLRHLKWVSFYRMNIIAENIRLKNKKVLDMGSGPQFTTEMLKEKCACVKTLDKFAPCDFPFDVNDDFTACFQEKEFDLVIMGAVIRYIQDKKLFLKRLAKIIQKDGFVFVDEFVHNYWNDFFLENMVSLGAMEQWPQENFTPLEKLEEIVEKTKEFKIEKIYSCWPAFFLEGKFPFPTWYSVLLKKK